ncbi:MAG: hypothetical protein H8Z69_01375 [Nanohaloarchaea archaeon]|nr:hypothetical protein [Candidatus Nanohaloarchaea archaeon]
MTDISELYSKVETAKAELGIAEHVFNTYLDTLEQYKETTGVETGQYCEETDKAAETLIATEERMRQLSSIINKLKDVSDHLESPRDGVKAQDVRESAKEVYENYTDVRADFILECYEMTDDEIIADPLERNEKNWRNGNGGFKTEPV